MRNKVTIVRIRIPRSSRFVKELLQILGILLVMMVLFFLFFVVKITICRSDGIMTVKKCIMPLNNSSSPSDAR